ncbi:hypothetical protein PROFUN_11477 [Planoprotostelium fungivorum]|uniref:F-box domain-containing protein n=1 Tax=Planoprotostelium fungivorum TaxID=1890364 RepID=A0A2P6N9W1_9EUKA|nr:hypothetical protein PROFUN_11477 [Planoprotostelium fungivorum]
MNTLPLDLLKEISHYLDWVDYIPLSFVSKSWSSHFAPTPVQQKTFNLWWLSVNAATSLDTLQWFMQELKVPLTIGTYRLAVERADFNTVSFIRDHLDDTQGLPLLIHYHQRLDLIPLIRDEPSPYSDASLLLTPEEIQRTVRTIIRGGDISKLESIPQTIYPYLLTEADIQGSPSIIRWLHDRGFIAKRCKHIGGWGDHDFIRWSIEVGYAIEDDIAIAAARMGRIDVLILARQLGLPIKSRAFIVAVENGHIDAMTHLHETGCATTITSGTAFRNSIRSGQLRSMMWLIAMGHHVSVDIGQVWLLGSVSAQARMDILEHLDNLFPLSESMDRPWVKDMLNPMLPSQLDVFQWEHISRDISWDVPSNLSPLNIDWTCFIIEKFVWAIDDGLACDKKVLFNLPTILRDRIEFLKNNLLSASCDGDKLSKRMEEDERFKKRLCAVASSWLLLNQRWTTDRQRSKDSAHRGARTPDHTVKSRALYRLS